MADMKLTLAIDGLQLRDVAREALRDAIRSVLEENKDDEAYGWLREVLAKLEEQHVFHNTGNNVEEWEAQEKAIVDRVYKEVRDFIGDVPLDEGQLRKLREAIMRGLG